MNPFDNMKLAVNKFTKSDKMIYDYIMTNQYNSVQQNIVNMAKSIGVSKSALLRFAKKIGYNGFSEFKYDLARAVHRGGTDFEELKAERIDEITDIYKKALEFLSQTVTNQQLEAAAHAIAKTKKIKIFGLNITGLTAQYLRMRFSKINIDAEAVTDYMFIPEVAQQGNSEDLHIYISTKGMDILMIDSIKSSNKHSQTMLITMNDQSKMSKYSNSMLVLPNTTMFTQHFFLNPQAINYIFIEILISYISEYQDQ